MHGSLLDERCIREKGTSLKDRQQKTVTASGKPAFHPPGCFPARTMRSWKCHAPMPVLPTSSLSSPFRESIAGNADSIKNVGHPWAGGMYGQPVLRCLPDTVKKGFRPTPSRLTAEGHGFKSCPAARKEKPLRWMSQGLFCTLLFSVLRQSPVLCHSLQAPAPSTTAASARSASGYRSLRPFYNQGRPRWADPSRNRNVPLIP